MPTLDRIVTLRRERYPEDPQPEQLNDLGMLLPSAITTTDVTIWARRDDPNPADLPSDYLASATVSDRTRYTIRFMADVRSNDVISEDDNLWNIDDVSETERNHEMKLRCSRRAGVSV